MPPDENERVLAACDQCERVYAAVVSATGSVRIIGRPGGCSCGGTTLVLPDADE